MTSPFSDLPDSSPSSASGCPSDRVLDLLLAGDLGLTRSHTLREHFSACPSCSARYAEISAFRDEAAPTLVEFSELVGNQPRSPRRSRRREGWIGGVLAAAAAVALWIAQGPTDNFRGAETRAKGSSRLGFYVKRADHVFEGGQGELLKPGDAIEFTYAAPSAGYLAILSVDGAGHASIYFPTGSRAEPVAPGRQLLAQSTILDAVLGRETLYAVWCEAPVELEPIRRVLESNPRVRRVAGCGIETLEAQKGLP